MSTFIRVHGRSLALWTPASEGASLEFFYDPRLSVTLPAASVVAANDLDMEAVGTASWTSLRSVLSKQTTNPHSGTRCLRVTPDGTGSAFAWQTTNMVVGSTYRIRGFARSDGNSQPVLGYGSNQWVGTLSTAWQAFDVTYTCDTNILGLYSLSGNVAHYVEFDDVTMERVDGGGVIYDGDMEASNVAVWSPFNCNLSKENGSRTGGAGAKVLRLTSTGVVAAAQQMGRCVIGNVYRIRGWARSVDGVGHPYIDFTAGGAVWTGTTSTAWQAFDFEVAALNTIFAVRNLAGAGSAVEFDDVSVENLSPSAWGDQSSKARHLSQATAGRRFAFDADGFGVGLPSIYANAVGESAYQCMSTANFAQAVSQPNTYFMLLSPADDSARAWFDGLIGGGRQWFRMGQGAAGSNIWATDYANFTAPAPTAKRLWCLIFNGANSYVYVNNGKTGWSLVAGPFNPGANAMALFGLGNSGGGPMPKGHCGPTMMVSGAANASKMSGVLGWYAREGWLE